MESDDLLINDGTFLGGIPPEPIDQAIARKSERATTLQALPELKKMISRLEERIVWYETNSNIPDDVRTDPKQFLIFHNSYTLTAQTLRSEKEYLQGLIDTNAKNRWLVASRSPKNLCPPRAKLTGGTEPIKLPLDEVHRKRKDKLWQKMPQPQ